MSFYVYIVASGRNGSIYIGSTDNLAKRIREHKTGARPGFTKTYGCDRLAWFETFASRSGAFRRERRSRNGDAAGSCFQSRRRTRHGGTSTMG
jgi:putative endonuclease